MIFPEPSSPYLDEIDRDMKGRMEDFYAKSFSLNSTFHAEADIDTRFAIGDQNLYNSLGYGNLSQASRRQFSFNRIRRVINSISGIQRQNRKSSIIVPIENGDEQTADQYTKLLLWNDQQENVLETISEAFEGALVTGLNLLQVWVDYRSDLTNGDIKVDNCSYNTYLIDPFFRKADLSDCNGLWKRSFLTRREVISLLPDKKEEIMSAHTYDARDGKFQYMPETYSFTNKDLLAYDEFFYRDYRKQKLLIDTQTGETMEWTSKNDDMLRKYLQKYSSVTLVETEVPTINVCLRVNDKVVYNGRNLLNIDRYPFIPVMGYFNPQSNDFPYRIQGVVRGLRDAQFLYNRRKVIELDILESQINSGWKYKENALVNPKDVFLSGQGRGLALKEEAMMTDVEQIQPAAISPVVIQLSEIMGREINEMAGVTEISVGAESNDKSGFMSALRLSSSITTLQGLFDGLDRSQKLLAKLRLDIIQANFLPGKVKRIIEEEPAAQFYNKAFGKFDAAVEDGLNTTTQRQMRFSQLLQLREAGVPVPSDVLLEACTLQDKKKLMDRIMKQEEQQTQMAYQQTQVAMQEQQAKIQLAQSRAVADQGLGLERLSRISENKAMAVERKAAAIRDENEAMLNLVKAIKEAEGIDLAHMTQIIQMQSMIKQQERESQQESDAVGQKAAQDLQQQQQQPQMNSNNPSI